MNFLLNPDSFHPVSLFATGQLPAEVGLNHYILLSALLFALGFFGVLLRRNTLVVYMCLELMLNASTLAAVAFSRFNGTMDGNVFVFFIITVAAAEVAVGLAIIVALFRLRRTVQLEELTSLKY
jgi:NADH-quinone oxidoreductase subunit K